jgi:choline monooxygenase
MNLSDYTFQPDLARATTIPARWYIDPQMLTIEEERIFGRTWQLVGRIEHVRNPGDYYSVKRDTGIW